MNILRVHPVEKGDVVWYYISVDKIAEYYYDGTRTKIGLNTLSWVYVDGDKTAELTKLLTVPTGGKLITLPND